MVSNPAPCLPTHTGRAPESRSCWEELPTEEEMAQVNLHLNEIAGLSAQGLTSAVVALSFSKQLVQPIRDRVHPGPVLLEDEATTRVGCMMQGPIRDRRCPKAHCLKQPTRAVSLLCLSMLFYFSIPSCSVFALESFLLYFPYAVHPLGCNQLGMSSYL